MTSANQGGSPIVFRDEDLSWIDGLADAVLTHDRPIHVPCEDSVVTIDDQGDAAAVAALPRIRAAAGVGAGNPAGPRRPGHRR